MSEVSYPTRRGSVGSMIVALASPSRGRPDSVSPRRHAVRLMATTALLHVSGSNGSVAAWRESRLLGRTLAEARTLAHAQASKACATGAPEFGRILAVRPTF
jgi:hypothetical protein